MISRATSAAKEAGQTALNTMQPITRLIQPGNARASSPTAITRGRASRCREVLPWVHCKNVPGAPLGVKPLPADLDLAVVACEDPASVHRVQEPMVEDEIQLISDGDGLAVIGAPAAVEQFLASEGLPSRELSLKRLGPAFNAGAGLPRQVPGSRPTQVVG
ncbi:hypothetical protein ACI2LF_13935 [Kribbella sp. NPDC020789]